MFTRNLGKSEKKIQRDGIDIKIHWTPDHVDMNGNETTNRLAKEAEQLLSDAHLTITKQDVQKATMDHIRVYLWNGRIVGIVII